MQDNKDVLEKIQSAYNNLVKVIETEVDYKNIKSFSAVITDIQGQALNCSYERGYTVHCERI